MKKRIKKIATLLMTAVTAISLSACGSSEATSGTGNNTAKQEIQTNADGAPVNADGKKLMEGVHLVMASDNFKPYRYQDESGKWMGYDFSVMDALSEILGFTYDFNEIEFSGVVTSVSSGKSDVAPTLTAKPERKEVIDFTEPYHVPKPLFAVKKDSGITSVKDLAGKKVAVTFATSWETMLNEQSIGATITPMDTLSSVVADVVAGRQDALFGDSVQISEYASENDLVTFEWTTDYTVPADDFGFKKGSAYVEPFNKALQYLKKTGKLQEIQKEWLGKESVTDWNTVTVTE